MEPALTVIIKKYNIITNHHLKWWFVILFEKISNLDLERVQKNKEKFISLAGKLLITYTKGLK